jgi:hypothetical protein
MMCQYHVAGFFFSVRELSDLIEREKNQKKANILKYSTRYVTLDRVPEFDRSTRRLVRCLYRACLRVN